MEFDYYKETFRKNLIALRKSMGLNQEEFAELIGISSTALEKWETGSSLPNLGSIFQMIQKVGPISIDELIGNSSTPISFRHLTKKPNSQLLLTISMDEDAILDLIASNEITNITRIIDDDDSKDSNN